MSTEIKHHVEFKFLDDSGETMLTLVVKDFRDLTCRIVEGLALETGSKTIELVHTTNKKEGEDCF